MTKDKHAHAEKHETKHHHEAVHPPESVPRNQTLRQTERHPGHEEDEVLRVCLEAPDGATVVVSKSELVDEVQQCAAGLDVPKTFDCHVDERQSRIVWRVKPGQPPV